MMIELIETPQNSSNEKLLHCPFCNTDMSIMGQRIWHPPFDCILYSFSFSDSEMNRQRWNRRVKE